MEMSSMVLWLGVLVSCAVAQPFPSPLVVIAESPYSVAKYAINVPLVTVDDSALTMIRDAKIRAVSPTEPLVTCQTNGRYYTEATPAVQVVLKKPLYIRPYQSYIPFPAEVTVVYGGLRMGLPVGSVIAPVSHLTYGRPQLVRVLYAVPSGPLPLQYPYYDPFAYNPPSYPQTQVLPVAPFQPSYPFSYSPPPYRPLPSPSLPASSGPSAPSAPESQQLPEVVDAKKPKPPLVTVLDFPSAVASPEVLFYQPPLDDSELGNRGPPEAIPPAGIVQSTQPIASLESFLNSKESPILNALREQAEKVKDKEEPNEAVLAL